MQYKNKNLGFKVVDTEYSNGTISKAYKFLVGKLMHGNHVCTSGAIFERTRSII